MLTRAVPAIAFLCFLAGCHSTPPAQRQPAAAATLSDIDPDSRFGIAIQIAGRECLSIQNANLKPGGEVKLVFAVTPQSIADAVVAGPGGSCPNLEVTPSTSYELRVTGGKVEPDVEGIAVVGPATVAGNDDTVTAHIDHGPQDLTFRSCTSSEGVHLTVWSGGSLQGKRIWHGYHHLDYGVEADCTDKDTAQ